MQRYGDVDRDSGVVAFEAGTDSIKVKFWDGGVYLYTYASAGSQRIERMKMLALRGEGLNAYINDHAKNAFVRKETEPR